MPRFVSSKKVIFPKTATTLFLLLPAHRPVDSPRSRREKEQRKGAVSRDRLVVTPEAARREMSVMSGGKERVKEKGVVGWTEIEEEEEKSRLNSMDSSQV